MGEVNGVSDLSGLASLDTAFFCGYQVSPHALGKAPKGEGFKSINKNRRLEPDRLGRLFLFSDGENATGKIAKGQLR